MNNVILSGRLTADPVVRYSQGSEPMAIANYTLAVDRMRRKNGEQGTDFITCKSFGKTAEFAEKYLFKGTKILVRGHIQTGSYEKDGRKVYTTDVIVDDHEFCESKSASEANQIAHPNGQKDDFISIPDGLDDEALPFN